MKQIENYSGNRNFGIEIELDNITLPTARKLRRENNILTGWQLKKDSSVPRGVEFISPVLSGKDGLKNVYNVFKFLTEETNAYASLSCGYHVHVEVKDFSFGERLRTLMRYGQHSSKIDLLVSPERQENNSTYCRQVSGMIDEIAEAMNYEYHCLDPKLENAYSRCTERHYALNLLSYEKYKTIEFRQHQGTIDSTKGIMWLLFCLNYIEQSKKLYTVPELNKPEPKNYKDSWLALKVFFLEESLKDISYSMDLKKTTVVDKFYKLKSAYPSISTSKSKDKSVRDTKFQIYNLKEYNDLTNKDVGLQEEHLDLLSNKLFVETLTNNVDNNPLLGLDKITTKWFEERMLELKR